MAGKTIAFYTMGDTRAVSGSKVLIGGKKRSLKMSEMWRLRAISLVGAGQTYGAATADAALVQLAKLPAGTKLSRVYFVGHGFGNNEGGYFFAGKPDREADFTGGVDQTLSLSAEDRMKKVAKALASLLDKDAKVEVSFLSCYTGLGRFTGRFYGELRSHGVKKLTVGAYRDYYLTVFNTDAQGNITGWADRITDKGNATVATAGANGIPPYQVTHQEIDLSDPFGGLDL